MSIRTIAAGLAAVGLIASIPAGASAAKLSRAADPDRDGLSTKAEKRIGERLPNVGSDDKLTDVVNDALGGSDVCYDKSGNIAECAAAKP